MMIYNSKFQIVINSGASWLNPELQKKGTGNREQGTGNREQGTGNREQGTGNREQGTGNR
jgi:hypothetical protein